VDNLATTVVNLSTTSAPVLRLRDRLYADRTLSDSYSIPLITMLDAIATGGTARAVGDRVLALFGAPRGRGRPPTRQMAVDDAIAAGYMRSKYAHQVVDDDERAHMEVLRLYRQGRTVPEIAFAVRWPAERVIAVLEPIHGRISNPPA
jgi:hypothetical protein